MEKRRVFIGGLSSQVTPDDLRGRFLRFGDVVDVDLKEKMHPTTGENSVFAFVDLKISEENLAKCFRLYSNTKWKGGTMRLEMAKESFLDRLKREREDRDKAAADLAPQPPIKTEALPPIPEKKTPKPKPKKENSSALPILPKSLRKEEKVVSFLDPDEEEEIKAKLSMKVGFVKIEPIPGPVVVPKLPKPIEEEQTVVSFLTGEEEERFSTPKAASKKKNKKEDHLTPNVDSSEKKRNKKGASSEEKEANSSTPAATINKKKTTDKNSSSKKKKKGKEDSDSDSDGEDSEDDHDGIPDFKGSSMLEKKPKTSVAGELFGGKVKKKKTVESEKKTLLHALNGVVEEKEQDEEVEVEAKVDEGEGKALSWAQRLQSFSSSVWDDDEKSPISLKKRYDSAKDRREAPPLAVLARNVDLKSSKVEGETPSSSKSELEQEKSDKKAKSEEVRLAKFDEMRKSLEKRKKIVESALTGEDGSSVRANKRVKFDDDDEEMEVDEQENFSTSFGRKKEKIPKSKNLFDEDDEEMGIDGDESEKNQLMVREVFLGERGNKLLALESSYGADERFKLDTRFLADDAQPTRPLKDLVKKSQSRQMVRFDPTRPDHLTQFQAPSGDGSPATASKAQKKKLKKEAKEKLATAASEGTSNEDSEKASSGQPNAAESTESKQPEKFYKVTGNLKERLGKEKDQSTASSFSLAALFAETANLPEIEDAEDVTEQEAATPTYEKPAGSVVPGWLKNAHARGEEEGFEDEEEDYQEYPNTDNVAPRPIKFSLTTENSEFKKLMDYYKNVSYDDSEECWQKWKENQKELMTMVSRRVKQTKRATKLRSGSRSAKKAAEGSEKGSRKRKMAYHKLKLNNKKKRKVAS